MHPLEPGAPHRLDEDALECRQRRARHVLLVDRVDGEVLEHAVIEELDRLGRHGHTASDSRDLAVREEHRRVPPGTTQPHARLPFEGAVETEPPLRENNEARLVVSGVQRSGSVDGRLDGGGDVSGPVGGQGPVLAGVDTRHRCATTGRYPQPFAVVPHPAVPLGRGRVVVEQVVERVDVVVMLLVGSITIAPVRIRDVDVGRKGHSKPPP